MAVRPLYRFVQVSWIPRSSRGMAKFMVWGPTYDTIVRFNRTIHAGARGGFGRCSSALTRDKRTAVSPGLTLSPLSLAVQWNAREWAPGQARGCGEGCGLVQSGL